MAAKKVTAADYYIKPRSVNFIVNDLGDVNKVHVSIASGTTIMVYVPEDDLIPYDDDQEYQKWVLTGYPTKLATSDAYYIYARLNRYDNRGMIIFSTKKYNVDGSIESEDADTQEGEIENPYFYIQIGSLTYSENEDGKTVLRILTFDSGRLSTPNNAYTRSEVAELYLSSKNDDTASGLIRFLKGLALPTGELKLEYKAVDTSGKWFFNEGVYADASGEYALGKQVAATGALASPFFDLQGADYIKFSLIAPADETSKVGLVFYDAEEKAIEGIYTNSNEEDGYVDREVLVPMGATKVRFTVWLEITGEYLQFGYISDEVKTHILSSVLTSLQLLEKKEDIEEVKKLFTENTAITAKAIQEAFVSKMYDDTVNAIISFNKGVKLPAGEQMEEYKDFDISSLEIITKGVGIFADSTDAEQFGEMVGTDADMVSTDFIDLQKANYIDISLLAAKDEASRMGLVFYNAENAPIKGYYISGQEEDGYVSRKIAVPEGATQIRFSAWSIADETLYLKLGYFADTVNTSLISSLIKADDMESAEFSENSLITAAAFAKLFKLAKDDKGNFYIRTPYPLASDKTVSSLGIGSDGDGGVSYDRLDSWDNYDAGAGAVLSATLGYELKQAIENIDLGDINLTAYLTKEEASKTYATQDSLSDYQPLITADNSLAASLVSGLATVATSGKYSDLSGVPTKLSDFTDDVVNGKYQPLISTTNKLDYSLLANTPSLADLMGSSAIGGTASSENFSAVYWDGTQWQTRTLYKWALESTRPTYYTDDVNEKDVNAKNKYFTDDRAKDALKKTTDDLSARIAKFEKMFQWGNGEDSYVKTPYALASDSTVSSLGVGSDGNGGVSYDRLDSWDNYVEGDGSVLSSYLGHGLLQRIEQLEDGTSGDFSDIEEKVDKNTNAITNLSISLNDFLTGVDVDDTINRWKELEKFLEDYTETATLAELLKGKQNEITSDNKLDASLVSGLATVATSGKYSDLSGTPTKLSDFTDDVVNGKYQPLISTTNRLAYSLLDGAPTVLKNPNALKFGNKSYDGSAEETITAEDLGAFTEHQTIYALTVKDSAGTTKLTYTPNDKAGEITLTKAMVGLGDVENTKLSTWAGTSNITTIGTITTGTWKATKIANDYIEKPYITIAGNDVNLGGTLSVDTLQTSLDIVTRSTDQEITGKKTFSKRTIFKDGIQIGNSEAYIYWDSDKNVLRTNVSFASDSTVSSLGVGSDGNGGVSYDRLDSWDNYDAGAGAVLSATLGYELKQAIENIDLGDFNLTAYLTKEEASKTYATISALNGKQNAITANNKLSASLVSGLATVATSGEYSDLSGLPTLGSLASKNSLAASDIPSLSWSKITSDKPTTLAGYGITDGISTSNIGSQSVNYATSAGSANKLSEERTIWGQKFDGSGDVSGALSNTGTITPLATHAYNIGSSSLVYEKIYTRYIDTDNGYWLRFSEGGVERMMIANGNVLIGTATDSGYKLYVNGDSYANGILNVANVIEANKGINIYGTLTGYVSGTDSDTWSITGQGAAAFSDTLKVQGKAELQSGLDVIGLIQGLDSVGGNTTWEITSDGAATVKNITVGSSERIQSGGNNFYIGNANNAGWVGMQDICSQDALGDSKWSIRTDGRASFGSTLKVTGATTLSSTLGVSGTATFDSNIKAKGYICFGANDDAYIYWDADEKVLRTNVSFASDKTVSSLGVGTDEGGGSADWGAVPTSVIPAVNGELNLGTSANRWNVLYANSMNIGDSVVFATNSSVIAYGTFKAASIDGNLMPSIDGEYNIGSPTMGWDEIYANGVNASVITEYGLRVATKKWVEDGFVTLDSEQDIQGKKSFENGIDIAGSLIQGLDSVNGTTTWSIDKYGAASFSSLIIGGNAAATQAFVTSQGYMKFTDVTGLIEAYAQDNIQGKYLLASGGTLYDTNSDKPLYIKGGITGVYIGFKLSNNTDIGSIGVNDNKDLIFGSNKVLHAGNTSFSAALTTGTKIGTITIGGTATDLYAPVGVSVDLSNYYNKTEIESKFASYYDKEGIHAYVSQEINTFSEEKLGVAASKGVTTSVNQNSTDLVTSGGVYTKLSDYVLIDTFMELDTEVGAMSSTVSAHEGKWDNLTTSTGLASGYIKQLKADTFDLGGSVVATTDDLDAFGYTIDNLFARKTSLATVATSGSYNDLTNKPTIPSAITVTNNLTSTSTSAALSANQGRVLNNKFADYLPLEGGTISGSLTVTGQINLAQSLAFQRNDANYIWANGGSSSYLLFGAAGVGATSYRNASLRILNTGNVEISKALTVSGTVTAPTFTQSSDEKLKSIVGDVRLSLTSMAYAPLIQFAWNNGIDSRLHVGTIAQYWESVLPEVVSTTPNDTLALAYGELGVAIGISLATHLTETNDEVSKLKKRIEQLETENKKLQERVDALVA